MLGPVSRSTASHCPLLALASAFVLASVSPSLASAQQGYTVERVETTDDIVRAFVVADLAPVEAVVREHASEAARRAAPTLFADRNIGTHRFRELRLDVRRVRFTPGTTNHDVRIEVLADITAERDHRGVVWNGVVPQIQWIADGRHRLGHGQLVVRVSVGIANGSSVVLRILGERLVLSDPIAADIDLYGRVLHTHAQPIPSHPSIAGLTPEAAALRGIEGQRLRFVVRFRRR
jgi:hypothetical protein